jgi:hypothetical protein
LVVVNTLIAANSAGDFAFDDCAGLVEAYGYNLMSLPYFLTGCTFGGNGGRGIISLDTIGPLQNNGGPTLTRVTDEQEAINATNAQGCIDQTGALLTTDQRGAPRVSGPLCDVGAFEFGSIVDQIFKDGFD